MMRLFGTTKSDELKNLTRQSDCRHFMLLFAEEKSFNCEPNVRSVEVYYGLDNPKTCAVCTVKDTGYPENRI